MVMDWRTARHLGAGSAESYDGTRREARLPELTGGQLQAFIAVGQSGAPHKQAWRSLEDYRDGDRDTRARPRLNPNQRLGNPLLPAQSMPRAANSSGIGLT